MPITADSPEKPSSSPARLPKTILLVRSGRGSGRTTYTDTYQKVAKLSSKFNYASTQDRDDYPNAVTLRAPISHAARNSIYKNILDAAVRNLSSHGSIELICGDWSPRYLDKEKHPGESHSMQEYLKELSKEFVIVDLYLECSPEQQFRRVKMRHNNCSHSTNPDKHVCKHERDADILDLNRSDQENYQYFSQDYNMRRARDRAADAILETDLGIKSITVSTNEDWPIDNKDGTLDLNNASLCASFDALSRFIVRARNQFQKPTIPSTLYVITSRVKTSPCIDLFEEHETSISMDDRTEVVTPFPWDDPDDHTVSSQPYIYNKLPLLYIKPRLAARLTTTTSSAANPDPDCVTVRKKLSTLIMFSREGVMRTSISLSFTGRELIWDSPQPPTSAAGTAANTEPDSAKRARYG